MPWRGEAAGPCSVAPPPPARSHTSVSPLSPPLPPCLSLRATPRCPPFPFHPLHQWTYGLFLIIAHTFLCCCTGGAKQSNDASEGGSGKAKHATCAVCCTLPITIVAVVWGATVVGNDGYAAHCHGLGLWSWLQVAFVLQCLACCFAACQCLQLASGQDKEDEKSEEDEENHLKVRGAQPVRSALASNARCLLI